MASCVSAAAAAAGGVMGKTKKSSPWKKVENGTRKGRDGRHGRCVKVACSSSVMDSYRMLRIEHGASESEVKQAFRRLALQYHPDVCRGRGRGRGRNSGGVEFHMINEAYDVVMRQLRIEEEEEEEQQEQGMMKDEDLELWEEWMGWEGGGIRDYSSHINPYI